MEDSVTHINIFNCRSTSKARGFYVHEHSFGTTGPNWLDDVICQGWESSIAQCRHGGWGYDNCGSDEDVGVDCFYYNISSITEGKHVHIPCLTLGLNKTF